MVSYHSADNAFTNWTEYNEMTGVGGWGNRSQSRGVYIRKRDGKMVRDATPGKAGSHGPQHAFPIDVRSPQHPVTRDLSARCPMSRFGQCHSSGPGGFSSSRHAECSPVSWPLRGGDRRIVRLTNDTEANVEYFLVRAIAKSFRGVRVAGQVTPRSASHGSSFGRFSVPSRRPLRHVAMHII